MASEDLQEVPQPLEETSLIQEKEQVEQDPPKRRGVKFSVGDELEVAETSMAQTKESSPSLARVKPVNPVTLCIYTLDNKPYSLVFPTGKYTTAGDIVKDMIRALSIPEEMKDVFSIWLVSSYLQLQLKSYHVPIKLFKRWKELLTQYTTASADTIRTDEPILCFRRNAFFPIKEEKRLITKRNSEEALGLLYYEAVQNVTKGRYPMSREELIELAGIQCAVDNKEFHEELHTPENLKENLKLYFPSHLLEVPKLKGKLLGGGHKPGIEIDLRDEYRKVWNKVEPSRRGQMMKSVKDSAIGVGLGEEGCAKRWEDIDLQLKLLYLQRCWNKPYYGCVMFQGQVERKGNNIKNLLVYRDRHVIVAINPESVHLFTDSSPREIMLFLTYDLFSWDFQPATELGENFFSSLWLEFDSTHSSQKVAKRLQIFSRQAPMMDAMISRCVDELNKKDEEISRIRGTEVAPTHSIVTNSLLPETKNYKEDKLKCQMYSDGEPISQFTLNLRKKKKTSITNGESDGTNL